MCKVNLVIKIFISILFLFYYSKIACSECYIANTYCDKDGLPHNSVWCLLQDSYGFVWVGTSNGLSCFDGYRNIILKTPYNKRNDAYFGNNSVYSLYEDKYKRIWIGTDYGIFLYDRNNIHKFDNITEYGVSISCEVSSITSISDEKILIATLGQGFFVFDFKNNKLEQFNLHSAFVYDVYVDKNVDKIYLSTLFEGILCYNKDIKLLRTYELSDGSFDVDIHPLKSRFLKADDKSLWIGDDTNNLFQLFPDSNKILQHKLCSEYFQTLKCLLPFSKEELLLGTNNGLYLYNTAKRVVSDFNYLEGEDNKNDQSINGIVKDMEGGFWVLTEHSGLIHISHRNKIFNNYNIPGGYSVNAFCEGGDDYIWIGSQNGLYKYFMQSGRIIKYKTSEGTDLCNISTLCKNKNELWIGTETDGIKVLDLQKGILRSYTHSYNEPNTIISNNINKILVCKNGDIYIGTKWGLCSYNKESDDFRTQTSFGAMISISDIYEDSRNNIWIATVNNGVYRHDRNMNIWKHYEYNQLNESSISGNSVITIFEDNSGNLWFGTNGNGLCAFDYHSERFKRLDNINKSFSNMVINSIEQDLNNNLWISTNSGLYSIINNDKLSYQHFTYKDGLKRNYYVEKSSFKTDNGELFFGGSDGFNVFSPKEFRNNEYTPPVYITDIEFSHLKTDSETKNILENKQSFFLVNEITIPYNYNSFTVYFAALSFMDPYKNLFSYKMEGIDNEWNNNVTNHSVSYTNLPPGKYCFFVRGTNNDGIGGKEIAKLHIIITPPWYMSSFAYIGYVILIIFVIVYIVIKRDLYIKQKYNNQIKIFKEEKEKELYSRKIEFFINLIHEIRTPLTLIKLPLDYLMSNEKVNTHLSIINKNVNYLLGVVNELLDFQKVESEGVKLHLSINNIVSLINDVYEQFFSSAEIGNIVIYKKIDKGLKLDLLIDKDKINKILVNLLSNAMKYASKRIELSLNFDNSNVYIYVEDDGPGIKDDEKEKIFQFFYQTTENILGTGIGLAYSRTLAESHNGTLKVEDSHLGGAAFILTLPLNTGKTKIEESVILTEDFSLSCKIDGEDPFLQKIYTVLLVEDNQDLIDMESSALGKWFNIQKARNGIEALNIVEQNEIDVIVSDVMMPVMDGFELCSKIKDNINFSHIPIILITAKVLPEAKAEGFSQGADAYVEKPFTILQLCMQIRNLLRLRSIFQKRMQPFITNNNIDDNNSFEYSLSAREVDFLKKMEEKIENQLSDENFSIDSLAMEMNMSRSNFYRKLKSLSGMSPNDYLKNYRLNRAAQLLKEGHRITEVFEKTGFCSSSYFAKCFKTKFGVLPKDFQNNKTL